MDRRLILSGLLAGSVAAGSLFSRRSARATDTLTQIATNAADRISRLIERAATLFNESADHLAWATDEERTALFGRFRRYAEFAWVGIASTEGRVVASMDDVLLNADVSSRPWFIAGKQSFFFGDVHEAVLLSRVLSQGEEPLRFVDFARPVVDARGNGVVLGAHLHWRAVSTVLQEQDSADVELLLVSRAGEVQASSNDWMGDTLPPDLSGRLRDGGHASDVVVQWPDGHRSTAVRMVAASGDLRWRVVCSASATRSVVSEPR